MTQIPISVDQLFNTRPAPPGASARQPVERDADGEIVATVTHYHGGSGGGV